MKRKNLFSALILLLAVCLSIAACAPSQEPVETETSEQGGEQTVEKDVFKLQAEEPQVALGSQFEINLMRQSGEQFYVLNDDRYTLSYETSDATVATVDEKGFVTGLKQGSADIKVTVVCLDGSTQSFVARVTVIAAQETSGVEVIVNQDIAKLSVGSQKTIAPEVYVDGESKAFTAAYSSSNTGVVAVNDNTVQGIAVGTATLTVTVTVDGKDYQQAIEITVEALSPLEIDKDTVRLSLSGAHTTDIVTPTFYSVNNGSFVADTTAAFTYTSSDETVFTVDASGKLTAVGEGSATLTVKVNGKDITATSNVIVYSLYSVIETPDDFLGIDGTDEESAAYMAALAQLTVAKEDLDALLAKVEEDPDWANTNEASEQIADAEEAVTAKQTAADTALKVITDKLNGYYELGNDIDFENLDFNPIGLLEVAANKSSATYIEFTGYLNGNGYSVKNITHNTSPNTFRSIITFVASGAHVENIGAENIVFPASSAAYSAGFVWQNHGTINDVYVTLTTNGRGGGASNEGFAGIVNRNQGVLTSSFVRIIDKAAGGMYGGIICTNGNAYVSSCLAYTNVAAPVYTNAASAFNRGNCYVDTDLESALLHAKGMGFSSERWTVDGDGLPKLKNPTSSLVQTNPIEYLTATDAFELGLAGNQSIDEIKLDGVDIASYCTVADGKLTIPASYIGALASGEYQLTVRVGAIETIQPLVIVTKYIATATDFAAISENMAGYYVLTADITLPDVTGYFVGGSQTAEFTGTIDGQGHTLTYNLVNDPTVSGNASADDKSLFGVIGESGVVKNIRFNVQSLGSVDNDTRGIYRRAAIAHTNNGLIENVFVNISFSDAGGNSMDVRSAGMVFTNDGAINNSFVQITYKNNHTLWRNDNPSYVDNGFYCRIYAVCVGGSGTISNTGYIANYEQQCDGRIYMRNNDSADKMINVLYKNRSADPWTDPTAENILNSWDAFVTNGFKEGSLWTKTDNGISFNREIVIAAVGE